MKISFVAAALVLPLLAPVPAEAASSPPTCHGERATLVGEPGAVVTGTGHRDVIVSNGAEGVEAGGGADLVCVTGLARGRFARIMGDAGADVIDARQSETPLLANPGTGDDRVRGTRLDDQVYAHEGRDVVDGLGGDDRVLSNSGGGHLNRDVIRLGDGDDEVSITGRMTHSISGGAGSDRLTLRDQHRSRDNTWTVDNQTGRAMTWSHHVRWSGLEMFYLSPPDKTVVRFRGSDADETVTMSGESGSLIAHLGAGDDTVSYQERPRAAAVLDFGAGQDLLEGPYSALAATDLDLAAGTWAMQAGASDPPIDYVIPVRGLEDATFESLADGIRFVGNAADNTLSLSAACVEVRFAGGAGDDRLIQDAELACGPTTASGDEGDDLLQGTYWDDVLLGGLGIDTTEGGRGTDTCEAETRVDCEA
jgi:Ca2+-binding RTX toxin-like protein